LSSWFSGRAPVLLMKFEVPVSLRFRRDGIYVGFLYR
jgi:hypothetical protein